MNLTYPTTLVLHALANGIRHGFDVIEATGLAGGTVYPILRRLERETLVSASWEDVAIAQQEQRPPRRYYELTAAGKTTLDDGPPSLSGSARGHIPRAPASTGRIVMTPRLMLEVALRIVRAVARLVPAASRADWTREWEAELWHQSQDRQRSQRLTWRTNMDLIIRALSSVPDAAWLRRQFTLDADAVHDAAHGVRMLLRTPGFTAIALAGLCRRDRGDDSDCQPRRTRCLCVRSRCRRRIAS